MMEKLCLKTNITQRLLWQLTCASHLNQRPAHTICNMDGPSLHLGTTKTLDNYTADKSLKQKPISSSSSHRSAYTGPSTCIGVDTEKTIPMGSRVRLLRLYHCVTNTVCLKLNRSLLISNGLTCIGLRTSVFGITTVSQNLPFRHFCSDISKNFDGKLEENVDSAELKSPEDITMVVKYVTDKVSKKDKMILSLPEEKIRSVIKVLQEYNLSAGMIQDLLTQKPGLLKEGRLQQCLSLLTGYGFTSVDLYKVLRDGQSVTKLKQTQIEYVFDALRKAGMKEEMVKELVTEEPYVLSLVEKDIHSRISQLKAYFKTEDVIRVIVKTPVVLVCDIEELVCKFNYAHLEMGASQRQIMYTYLFAYSLYHVQCRHQFLVRAGLFGTEKASKASNPRLQDVIDTSDADFVKQFGGMHVDEYLTFCKMMDKSYQEEED